MTLEKSQHTQRSSASHTRSIGITEKATPLSIAWDGELRVRFSDFQVNEIREDGKVLHLTSIGLGEAAEPKPSQQQPRPREAEESKPVPEDKGEENQKPTENEQARPEIPEADVQALAGLTSLEFAQSVVKLFNDGPGEKGERKEVTSDAVDDRPARGQIHQEIRRIFSGKIETSTNSNGGIVATIMPSRGKKRGRGGRGRGPPEDKPAGEYLHFSLYKDNRDTMDATNQIARLLRVKPQAINYAGTKDRRASTVQRCSVRYQRDRALAGINGKLWGVTTGDYEYKNEPVHLGQLLGNEFTIVIKNCTVLGQEPGKTPQDAVDELQSKVGAALQHMSENGWINYFGHQRFGTHEIGTHEVGKLLLGSKFEEAVNAILHYDPAIAARAEAGEIPEGAGDRDQFARHHACMLFQTDKDVAKAIRIMPRRFSAETSILRHLTRQSDGKSRRDFFGALLFITRGLRSMYLHAYQSLIWNHVASRRWRLHGAKVIKGDLIVVEAEKTPLIAGQDEDGQDIINAVDDDDDTPLQARPLSEEEASSGRYTIHDIVLPAGGYEVIYPDNEIGEYYKEIMGREENGGLDPHDMRRKHREFSLPGRYRKLMNRFLGQPSVQFRLYGDDNEQMQATDLDVLKEQRNSRRRERVNGAEERDAKRAKTEDGDESMEDAAAQKDDAAPAPAVEVPGEKDQKEEKIAAVVKFQLGRSAYATVALRELMGDPEDEEGNV